MRIVQALERLVRRWRTAFRNTDSGRFISREEYDALPEEDRAKVRFRVDG